MGVKKRRKKGVEGYRLGGPYKKMGVQFFFFFYSVQGVGGAAAGGGG